MPLLEPLGKYVELETSQSSGTQNGGCCLQMKQTQEI